MYVCSIGDFSSSILTPGATTEEEEEEEEQMEGGKGEYKGSSVRFLSFSALLRRSKVEGDEEGNSDSPIYVAISDKLPW